MAPVRRTPLAEAKTSLAARLASLAGPRTLGRHPGCLARSQAHPAQYAHAVPAWAIVSAALTPLVLTAGWLVAEAVQPASYSPIQDTISSLAGQGGSDRWIMTAVLFAVGGCYLVTAAGLTGLSLPARSLLLLAGMCSVGIATSPETAAGPGPVHLAWTAVGGIAIAVWPTVAVWRAPARPLVLRARAAAAATIVFVIMLGWVAIETRGGGDLGIAERLASSPASCWPLLVAVGLRRASRAVPAQESADQDGCPADTTG